MINEHKVLTTVNIEELRDYVIELDDLLNGRLIQIEQREATIERLKRENEQFRRYVKLVEALAIPDERKRENRLHSIACQWLNEPRTVPVCYIELIHELSMIAIKYHEDKSNE